jgi:YesN/AraC family two-component response regulator
VSNRILIVDDDPEFREEFKDCFEGYGVSEAKDGRVALNLLKKPNEIDLVILDLKMSGLNGIEVLKEIKKSDPNISTIILTGFGTKETVIEALREQADDFLEKPIDIEKFKYVVDKILDTKEIGKPQDIVGIESKIQKIKNYLERNCFKKVTLKDAASVVFLSPKYLSRVFKEVTGKNFNELKLNIKLNKACELLTNTKHSVEHISYKLGYENAESFIRIFIKKFKTTPTQYRKKKLTKSAQKKTVKQKCNRIHC